MHFFAHQLWQKMFLVFYLFFFLQLQLALTLHVLNA